MFRYVTDKKGNPDLRLTATDIAAVFGCTYRTGLNTIHATGGRTAGLRDIFAAASNELKFRIARRLREFGETIADLILCLLTPDWDRRVSACGQPLFISNSLAYQDGRFRSFEDDRTVWLRGKGESPWMRSVLSTWALILILLGPDAVQPMFEAYDLLENKRMRIRDGESIEIIDGRIIRAKNTRAGAGDPVLVAFLATALDLAAVHEVGDTSWAARRDGGAIHAMELAAAQNGDPSLYEYLPEWVRPQQRPSEREIAEALAQWEHDPLEQDLILRSYGLLTDSTPEDDDDNDDDPWMHPLPVEARSDGDNA